MKARSGTNFFRNKKILLSLVFLLISGAALLFVRLHENTDVQKSAQRYEKTLHALEADAVKGLNELYSVTEKLETGLHAAWKEEYEQLFRTKGIVYLIYERDSLIFWSDHSAAVENYRKEVCLDNPLAKLRNGWFEVIRHQANSNSQRHYLALILLKSDYSYQNKYLISEFPKWFHLPENFNLNESALPNSAGVKNTSGNTLFHLTASNEITSNGHGFIHGLIALIFLSALCVFFYHLIFNLLRGITFNNRLLIFTGTLVALRFVMVMTKWPGTLYRTPLYDASVFGNADSFWFSHLGDVIINSLLIFMIALLVQRRFTLTSKNHSVIATVSGLIVLFSFSLLINSLIRSLVQNSHISFRINDLFSLNAFSYAGFCAAGLLFFSFSLFAGKLIAELIRHKYKPYLLFAIFSVVHLLLSLLVFNWTAIATLWPIVVMACIFWMRRRHQSITFSYGLPLVICFSIVSAHLFNREESEKEIGTRKVYAENLSSQQDDVAENLFVDIEKKISQDKKLSAMVFSPPVNSIDLEQRIRQVYFSGYWERFDVLLSVVDSACNPLIQTINPVHGNNSYFDQQIENRGLPTACPSLHYIDNTKENTRYVARIKINPPAGVNRKPALLYAELEPKLNPDVTGFPELLLDKSVKTNSQLSDYSYAMYKNDKLIMRSGKYNFNYRFNWKKPADEGDFAELKENEYHHLIYNSGQTTIVLSMPDESLKGGFTANSYFFAFFSMLFLTFLLVREIITARKKLNTSLNARMQLLLIMVVLISLIAFGTGTFIFVRQQFESQNVQTLNERTKAVYADLQTRFADLDTLRDTYKEYTAYTLKKVSNIFLTDVTIYDLRGNVFASSQPRLFEEGILSWKMNPRAFMSVTSSAISDLILRERIGLLEYYSSYQPFFNKSGKLTGFLNLPYFSKQTEQEREITLYITALVNIYVILFAFSTLIALFVSNLVTKPLRILRQKFSTLRLGKTGEPIAWKEKDEIGALVKEYNKMIAELEYSAEKLARSERESAWREMAKQVAHEIKNPLTPMKLSIQHLQRTLEGANAEEMKERIQKVSAMMIEQIETLSHIASEFSAFAKMPKPVITEIDLASLLNATVQLFKNSEGVELTFTDKTEGDALISADKDQCARVFTNLLKNAVQAIPENREGRIDVSVYRSENKIIAEVKDNGTGIDPEVVDKIFIPNFSTKTEGMGLGLAMVKNIVESFNGSIWFETKQGEGTTFFIEFEALKPEAGPANT